MKIGIINGIDFDKLIEDAKIDVMWHAGVSDCNCVSGAICLHWMAPSRRASFIDQILFKWATSTSKGF